MRRIIAAMELTLDGAYETSQGGTEWVTSWDSDHDNLMNQVDACVLGRGMYAGYSAYWRAILADPAAILPFTGKRATKGEIAYAEFAERTPHYLLSTTLASADWQNTQVVSSVQDIAHIRNQSGKDIYVVGGGKTICSLLDADLIDELRLTLHSVTIVDGKSFFAQLTRRHSLRLDKVTQLPQDAVRLTYQVTANPHQG